MKNRAFPLAMAALWGTVFGSALHSWTLGLSMGLCMGLAFGLFNTGDEEKPEGETAAEPTPVGGERDGSEGRPAGKGENDHAEH